MCFSIGIPFGACQSEEVISSSTDGISIDKEVSVQEEKPETEARKKIFRLTLIVDGAQYLQTDEEEGTLLSIAKPMKEGFDFQGWYTDEGCLKLFTGTQMPSGDLILYGKFVAQEAQVEKVSVTYCYGTEIKRETQEKNAVLDGETAREIESFLRERGYVFVAWKDIDGKVFSMDVSVTQNLTLIAEYYSDGLKIENGVVKEYQGESTEVIVPHIWNGGEVTAVSQNAFSKKADDLVSVRLAEGITKVEDYAFKDCIQLCSVNLPTTLIALGKGVFTGCVNLASGGIDFAGNDTYPVENGLAFADRQKTAVMLCVGEKGTQLELPESVKTVMESAFYGSWVSGTLDLRRVTKIEKNAFTNSVNLTEIILNKNVQFVSDGLEEEGIFEGCVQLHTIACYDPENDTTVRLEGTAFLRNEVEIPANLLKNTVIESIVYTH